MPVLAYRGRRVIHPALRRPRGVAPGKAGKARASALLPGPMLPGARSASPSHWNTVRASVIEAPCAGSTIVVGPSALPRRRSGMLSALLGAT